MIYNDDGSLNITVVDGSTRTGIQASDGSINIVLDDSSHLGLYHPCGAFRVNSSEGNTIQDPSGAYYINTILGRRGVFEPATPPTPSSFITYFILGF